MKYILEFHKVEYKPDWRPLPVTVTDKPVFVLDAEGRPTYVVTQQVWEKNAYGEEYQK